MTRKPTDGISNSFLRKCLDAVTRRESGVLVWVMDSVIGECRYAFQWSKSDNSYRYTAFWHKQGQWFEVKEHRAPVTVKEIRERFAGKPSETGRSSAAAGYV